MPRGNSQAATVLLSSPVRRRIVELVREAHGRGTGEVDGEALGSEGLTAAQIAKAIDLHVTTARFHLDQLESARVLISSSHKHPGAGRPRKVYALPPEEEQETDDIGAVRLLTGLLAETFTATRRHQRIVTPDEAGFVWAENHIAATDSPPATTAGEWLGKVGGLIDVLERWGYAAELSTSDQGRAARLDLPHCPFRELAQENTEVVCGIHRGLIAGTMQQLGESDTDVTLLPFANGTTCIAHVRRTTPFESTKTPNPVTDQEDSP